MSPRARMEDATVMVAGCSERANRMPRSFSSRPWLVPEKRDGARKFQHLELCSLSRQADLLLTFTGQKGTRRAIAKALNLLCCWETIGDDVRQSESAARLDRYRRTSRALTHWPLVGEGKRRLNFLQDETVRIANRCADR